MNPEPGPQLEPTTDCCGSAVDARIARHFDTRMRERAAGGALPPIHAVSQRLLDALAVDVAEDAPSVLELGCGGGALTVSLLKRGASSGTGVDLSTESLDVARRRAAAADLDRLLGNSVAAAQWRYAFSVPMSSGWRGLANRVWSSLEDATQALRGRPCPGYVHDIARIEARLAEAGFHRVWSSVVARLWYVAVFDRPAA